MRLIKQLTKHISPATRAVFSGFITLTLFACSGAPSEDDIKSALDKQRVKENAAFGNLGIQHAKLDNVEKNGCDSAGENAYQCDVTITRNGSSHTVPIRFVKTNDGWAMTR